VDRDEGKGVKRAVGVCWTDEEEVILLKMGKDNIKLEDTALGRAKRRKMSECKQAVLDMSNKEFEELLAARANRTMEDESKCNGEMAAVKLILIFYV
jgi:hypothetical protein